MAAAWLHQVHSNSAGSWFGILNIRNIYLSLCTNSSHWNQKYTRNRWNQGRTRLSVLLLSSFFFKKNICTKKNLVHNISLSATLYSWDLKFLWRYRRDFQLNLLQKTGWDWGSCHVKATLRMTWNVSTAFCFQLLSTRSFLVFY